MKKQTEKKWRFFIGKPVHWLIIAFLVPLGFAAGQSVLHVTHFVIWASLSFTTTSVLIIFLWLSSHEDELLTRDPLPDEEDVKLREYAD